MPTGAITTVPEKIPTRGYHETTKMVAVVTAILQAMSMTDNNKATATKGDSAVGYLALCSAWEAAKKASTAKLPGLPTTAAFEEIQQFNISLATEERKLLIDGTPDKKGWDAIKATVKQKASEVDWSKEWSGCDSERKATADNSDQWQKNNPRGFTDSHIAELRGLINATATAAAALAAELKKPITTGSTLIETQIQELGKQAMCGATGKHVYASNFCKDTAVATDGTKATTCQSKQWDIDRNGYCMHVYGQQSRQVRNRGKRLHRRQYNDQSRRNKSVHK
uniref:Variant surface glycoprotein 1125.2936 n=1 Tax=Trypanosoma brucei TaxID=5691 RepID=A0A1J0R512_9TRYP|nr:variant surface glycoprotein 1125.2936 [Trypanosoma brucei]